MSEAIARTDQNIAKRETKTPEELVAEGQRQAKALMQIVAQAGLSKNLGGSKPHLEVEAWQTIGRFNGFLTDIVWTRPVIEGGVKVGYEARGELVSMDTGEHLIGAEACCFFDEEIERADGTMFKRWDDDYAVRSMAQTRAQSKLGRMAFAWVAVLAGYSGTPAEEMEGVKRPGGRKITFPFPDEIKGKTPAECDLATLQKMLPVFEKAANDPKNKYRDRNEQLVNAIKEAITEKIAKPESPAAPPDPAAKDEGKESPSPPAGDVPLLTVDIWKARYEACTGREAFNILEGELQKVWSRYSPEEQVAMKMIRDRMKTSLPLI